MKFVKAEAFEKHLEESLPEHPSHAYLLLLTDPFERTFLTRKLTQAIGESASYIDPEHLITEMDSPSLFVDKRVLVCDDIQRLKVKTLPLSADLIVILSGKEAPACFDTIKKECVTLDLTKEKPWERKERLKRWLLEIARKEGKTLPVDAALYILEVTQLDWSTAYQEIEKIFTFCGDTRSISLDMVRSVCALNPTQTEWQLSEAMIWGGTLQRSAIQRLDDLYGFVGKLRYQLNLGIQLLSGAGSIKLSAKRKEKLEMLAQKFSVNYFQLGLQGLFHLELRMRSGLSNHLLLLDHFYTHLAKRRDALPTSQPS